MAKSRHLPVRLLAISGERKLAACSLLEGQLPDPSSRRKLAAILSADVVGVCISCIVYDAVEGKLSYGFDFLGEQQVKNIPKPVRVYRVRSELAAINAAYQELAKERRI